MTPLAWMDVISNDIERTLAYYARLFGWSSELLSLSHGEGYRVVRSGDVIVAGAEQVAAERQLDPVWTVMVEAEGHTIIMDTSPDLREQLLSAGVTRIDAVLDVARPIARYQDAERKGPDGGPGVSLAWFSTLYQILLGLEKGPRFGSFVAIYGIAETRALIERALAGELAAA